MELLSIAVVVEKIHGNDKVYLFKLRNVIIVKVLCLTVVRHRCSNYLPFFQILLTVAAH